ncbi:hypothetical protein [Ensifer sp. LC163]|uniref:hypothetical protein n=1 Tax=Ensifer sp. LC163 TaxID=1120652 RepID=UPI0008138929|nr:hypothetical protein [Ensifer sp. LC163]OCP38964.1 hypothetical protein BC360_02680 [Ensifer sp. LC163]
MRSLTALGGARRTTVSGFKYLVPASLFGLLLVSSGCSSAGIAESPLFSSAGSKAAVSAPSVAPKQGKLIRVAEADDIVEPLPARKRVSAYLGRAPYICSPSGFGHTSRCFLRSSL